MAASSTTSQQSRHNNGLAKNVRDLVFQDFMPLDEKSKKPVKSHQPGSLHFHMNIGSCYDSHIAEQMNSFVPKHKSYLKESDLAYVAKPTKEEENAANEKEKDKDGFILMFE